ncbi:MAG TPA: uroporphyrinogen-III C-methyltransferase [Verrucomicrobiae bacterium]|nr:uroporphyrinogen-III C-methyltransferase [Verrucomicrobiae bacterium]
MTGKVYLVGAGPGAPDLITVRGAHILQRADIVFYDALVHRDTLALAVEAEKVAVGKRCGSRSTAQRFINKRLIDAAQCHAIVVRLKGGDPMLFGRAQEEIDALKGAGIDFEVVPGVTAALAASAELETSLTRRGVSRSVTFVTPRVGEDEPESSWIQSVLAADSAVLYMAAGQIDAIATALLAAGLIASTPVVVVENSSLTTARRIPTTLAKLAQTAPAGTLSGPALICLGEVFRQQPRDAIEMSNDDTFLHAGHF